MVNTLCGFPIEHTGGHVAIRHDARMHKENEERRDRIKPWEWWLGDKAYVGCSEFLTEFKKPIGGQLTPEQVRCHHAPTARLHRSVQAALFLTNMCTGSASRNSCAM